MTTFQDFQKVFLEFGEALTTTLTPILNEFANTAREFYEICWRVYREAGLPYGESDEGMMRWFQERAMAEQMAIRAAAILAHHETLSMMRKRVG